MADAGAPWTTIGKDDNFLCPSIEHFNSFAVSPPFLLSPATSPGALAVQSADAEG